MDLGLTQEQEILRRSARDFLEAECPTALVRDMESSENDVPEALWGKMASLGWMGIINRNQYDGNEGSYTDLAVLLEEMGRFLVPGPFFNSVVETAPLLNAFASNEIKSQYIPQISNGAIVGTCAFQESDYRYSPEAVKARLLLTKNGYSLNGTKLFVEHAMAADLFVTIATHEDSNQISMLLVNPSLPGITIQRMESLSGEPLYEVNFDNVEIHKNAILGEKGRGWEYIRQYLDISTIMSCARSVGGTQAVIERTVEYVKGRVQFGRPIGSFQSVQHDCADMVNKVDAARLATFQAIAKLEDGDDASREISLARMLTDHAYKWTTLTSQQLHGGVAFMKEYDLQLWTRRARVAELKFELASVHRERYSKEMGLK